MGEPLEALAGKNVQREDRAGFTDDAFLGGRIVVRQPARGYRAGVDAVLLAALAPDDLSGRVLDVGAGVGTVGLCVAARCSGAEVVLAERQPELLQLARRNIDANGFAGRVRAAQVDVAKYAEADGIADGSFDFILANPPYHETSRGTEAPNASKAASHAMPAAELDLWARFMARMAAPGAIASVIHKAQALPNLLSALDGRFGGLCIRPIHSRAEYPALRVIVSGVKGSRAPFAILPAFVLHEPDGAFTAEAQAILRAGRGM